MKRWIGYGLVFSWMAAVGAGAASLFPRTDKNLQTLASYLNQKTYNADKALWTKADLEVGSDVDAALEAEGLSVYTLLRNEPFARHGYVFKDEVLRGVFEGASWYKPDPNFHFGDLSKMESKNVDFIQSIETTYDYSTIAATLGGWDNYDGYFSEAETEKELIDHKVLMSLRHVRLNPSRLLRNVILAKHGYIFNEPTLKEIFAKVDWYRPSEGDIDHVSAELKKEELIDMELLRKKEWVDLLNSVNITLPPDVISIPTLGYNALFIRQLRHQGQTYYYSSQFIHEASAASPSLLNDHQTDVEKLVPDEVVSQIKAEKDPLKKLGLFFQNKKYAGYADKLIFNHSDMEIPSYLAGAVKDYGLDYHLLLRKEIHARVGAKFADKRSAAIFSQCSWFKPRYDLTPRTVSRFPAGAKINPVEIANFSLLEGEEFGPQALANKGNLVVDNNGNLHFIQVGPVTPIGFKGPIQIGSDFSAPGPVGPGELQKMVDDIFTKYHFDLSGYFEKEVIYSGRGM